MPLTNKSRLNTNNTTESQFSQSLSSPPNQTDVLTLGLPLEWQPTYSWAHDAQILPALSLLIDAAHIHKLPTLLSPLLEGLRLPDIKSLVMEWADYNDDAYLLQSLVNASYLAPPKLLILDTPASFTESTVHRYKNLDRNEFYIFLCSAERLPVHSDVDKSWFAALRLWLLIQAMRRARRGVILDHNLCEIASKLRAACDTNDNWRILFQTAVPTRIQKNRLSFTDVTQALRYFAIRYSDSSVRGFTLANSTKSKLLNALQSVVSNQDAPVNYTADFPLLSASFVREGIDQTEKPQILYVSSDDDALYGPSQLELIGSTGTSDGYAKTPVNPKESYIHQEHQAKSVLLATREELHHLPWTWSKPSPYELPHLIRWNQSLLTSSDLSDRILGVYIWIALHTGRSFLRTLDIGINSNVGPEWSLDPKFLLLHRLPPERRYVDDTTGWHPKTEEEKSWVIPPAKKIAIVLSEAVKLCCLEALAHRPGATNLGSLWFSPINELPSSHFHAVQPDNLKRVTPGMLGQFTTQRLFSETGDSSFARLATSHPRTGLPGECAYVYWPLETVTQSLNPESNTNAADAHECIGMGSRLAPIESLLVQATARASERLSNAANGNDLVKYHNLYTAMLSMALFAGTGMRPVHDPIVSREHIDHALGILYVADKRTARLASGRLAIIPDALNKYLQDVYASYLMKLAQIIEPTHADLAAVIQQITIGSVVQPRIPYLFFLTTEGGLNWQTVTSAGIRDLELFDWPLPMNLFRHRFSNSLRSLGLDPEIIECLTGHEEAGAETYGDTSPRCFLHDLETAKPKINQAYDTLGFILPDIHHLNFPTPEVNAGRLASKPLLGSRARQKIRRELLQSAKQKADQQIRDFLDQRNCELTDLSAEDMELLNEQLLLTPDRKKRYDGAIRYSHLLKRLDRVDKRSGRRGRLKYRYQSLDVNSGPFTELAPRALERFQHIQQVWLQLNQTFTPSRLGRQECAALAALALCIENRVSDHLMLNHILRGIHYRLVSLRKKLYVEYNPNLKDHLEEIPVIRLHISKRTASLLNGALGGNVAWRKAFTFSVDLTDLCSRLSLPGSVNPPTAHALINALIPLTDQVNHLSLPGVLAGYLGGRVRSISLSWNDWLRLETGQVFTRSDQATASHAEYVSWLSRPVPSGPVDLQDTDARIDAAHAFYKAIWASIRTVLRQSKGTRNPQNIRVTLERQISRLVTQHAGQVSSAVLMLGQWIQYLLTIKYKSRGYLTIEGGISRYLSALSPAFKHVGYAVNLHIADEDEVTSFYSEVLTDRTLRNTKILVTVLRRFHRWAASQGVSDPIWSELPQLSHHWLVSPHIITETEYQLSLALMQKAAKTNPHYSLLASVVLVLCYRFGLRPKEALGLEREDWISMSNQLAVLVRKNKNRDLKTRSSRRIVPNAINLTPHEKRLMQSLCDQCDSLHGKTPHAPLLVDLTSYAGQDTAVQIKRLVNKVLQAVTQNEDITLYAARHSFANRLSLALFDSPAELWIRLRDTDDPTSIRKLLLNLANITRRSSWAVCRTMGHFEPSTTYTSYLHHLDAWADSLVDLPEVTQRGHYDKAIILENIFTKSKKHLRNQCAVDLQPHYATLTPALTVQWLRLIAYGSPPGQSAASLAIHPDYIEPMEQALRDISLRIRWNTNTEIADFEILRHITEPGWQRLLDLPSKPMTCDYQESSVFLMNKFIQMIGPSRQLVIWEDEQLRLIRTIIDCYGIHEDEYDVFHDERISNDFAYKIQNAGFKARSNRSDGKFIQIDTVDCGVDENLGPKLKKRCALLYIPSAKHCLANNIEFIMAGLIWAAAHQHSPTTFACSAD